jgi:hypothetical protein
MMDLFKGGLTLILYFFGAIFACVVVAFAAILHLLTVAFFWGKDKGLPFIGKLLWRKANWLSKRFADLPFLILMIAFVFFIRNLIATYDPEAALSFLDVWERIAQAGVLTVSFSLAFFGFLYFNFRTIFRYLYPESKDKTEIKNSFANDFENIKPWQRLLSIPLLFVLLLWLFHLSLKVMQVLA